MGGYEVAGQRKASVGMDWSLFGEEEVSTDWQVPRSQIGASELCPDLKFSGTEVLLGTQVYPPSRWGWFRSLQYISDWKGWLLQAGRIGNSEQALRPSENTLCFRGRCLAALF